MVKQIKERHILNIKKIISEMTLEEKAGLCSGADFWRTKAVERLNVPQMMVSDGPHGLRKQDDAADHVGINDSIKAVCFPPGVTIASSFDRDLINTIGRALGESAQAEELGIVLGPAVNIKRSPLCGRNFEYLSEDPYLSSEMATSQIKGIQSQGIGTSIKHYLANSQEHRRLSSDSIVDERTLREIYLPTFEKAVKEAKPWTVMCSYNRINGIHASEHYQFLTSILRDEWGFDGFVVSDWGAVNDRVKGLAAGLDLEMPYSHGETDKQIVQAVKNGTLDEALLDKSVKNILGVIDKWIKQRKPLAIFDREAQHKMARKAAGESMVLLKNERILPLKKSGKIAFIGGFAKTPRFQGGGSSHINAFKQSNALHVAMSIDNFEIIYADGYGKDITESMLKDAVSAAQDSDIAVVFAGLPDSFESEGYDRPNMYLPDDHNRLIEAVAAVQPDTVVVLHNGSPVEMPWINKVKGVLEAYLGGQAVGEAVVDILFGDVNPSGKLAETFPLRLEDNPSHLYYLGEKDAVEYREGEFVGYRYYDTVQKDVLFPFGHGLSYTQFSYTNLTIGASNITENDTVSLSVDIRNSGDVAGKEIAQLYIAPPKGDAIRPLKELKGFHKVHLEPGENKTVHFNLDKRSFAYFNMEIHDWFVESGNYDILIGSSSRDIRIQTSIQVNSTQSIPVVFNRNSLMGDILAIPEKAKIMTDLLGTMNEFLGIDESSSGDVADEAITAEMKKAMFDYMPIRNLVCFGNGKVTFKDVEKILEKLNQ